MATVGPGDFVKVNYAGRDVPTRDRQGNVTDVTHDDQKPLTLYWDSRPYVCEVGKDQFVPFEAMMVAFGDPRSGATVSTQRDPAGNVLFVSDRATEVRRLRTLYDNQLGVEGEILYAPEATVTDVEGDQIKTVLDDPSGDSVIPVQTTLLDREELLNQLQRQQRMIETLASAQGIDLAAPEASQEPAPSEPTDPFSEPPEDK